MDKKQKKGAGMKKLNILITSIIDLKKTPYSRLHRFIGHLLKRGHKITVISIRDRWKNKGITRNIELVKKISCIYLPGKSNMMQELLSPLAAKKLAKKAGLNDIDIHFSYNSLIAGYFIGKELKKHNINTVYDLADDLPEMAATSPQIAGFLRPVAGMAAGYMLKKSLEQSSVVTITAREFLKSMNIKKYNYAYLPNGVDTKMFKPKKKKQRKDITIGYVGALREWVDLRPMLLAVKELHETRKYKLRVLVVGGEEDLWQYKRFVKKNNIEKIVEFTGNVSYDEVPKHINEMDITTMPFKKTPVTDGTCPLKLLEYLACEKAAIVTRLNETKKMLGSLVLYADTKEEWKKQISLLYHDWFLREKLGKEGRAAVEKSFSWERICKELEKLLIKFSKR